MMTERDRTRLRGVHPELIRRLETLFDAMERAGYKLFVVEGLRSRQRQGELWRQGRTAPGRRVTNCDGIVRKSNHQVKPDGFGHACDVAFEGATPYPPEEDSAWIILGANANRVGLDWGGDWQKFPDRPHLELPNGADIQTQRTPQTTV